MLLASAATAPALAAGEPGDHRGFHRDSSAQSSGDHGNRSNENERPRFDRGGDNNDHGDSGQQQEPRHRDAPVMRIQSTNGGGDYANGNGGANANGGERRHFNGFVNRSSSGGEAPAIQPMGGHQDAPDSVRDWRRDERRQVNTGPKIVEPTGVVSEPAGTLRDTHRLAPSVFRNRVPMISSTPREGTQPPLRVERHRATPSINWSSSHWRSDHRYDWQNHRRHHRSLFHLGFYYDPFGWGYRPYQVGWRLWPSYYSSNYWLTDPWQYRLPYAPPGYRWIRYYDDALLVDTWNGQVVDVIYNFFW
jgi:hypothetical protein